VDKFHPRAPFWPNCWVQRDYARGQVFRVVGCVWDRHCHAWDVTMVDEAGQRHGEFGHNLEYAEVDNEQPV